MRSEKNGSKKKKKLRKLDNASAFSILFGWNYKQAPTQNTHAHRHLPDHSCWLGWQGGLPPGTPVSRRCTCPSSGPLLPNLADAVRTEKYR